MLRYALYMLRYLFGNDYQEFLRKEVLSSPLPAQAQILNIACEYDLVPAFLRKDISEQQVYGIEINEEIVKQNKQIRYCNVDRDVFPFQNNQFDLVLSIFGIEHFKTDRVFLESFRVLKPGGRFIFIVPNILYPMFLMNFLLGERFARFYYRRIVHSSYMPHRAYYRFNSVGKLNQLSKQVGFKKINLLMLGPSNALSYVGRYPWAKRLVIGFERMLTNVVLCRFKPYIIAVLEK